MSKPDEATSKIVMGLLSVIEAAGRQRENLLPANKVRTAARDGERGRARVGPGLGPLVMERLAVAGVVVLPGLLLAGGRVGTSAEDVRLADGRVERPPPAQQGMVSVEYRVVRRTYWYSAATPSLSERSPLPFILPPRAALALL